MRFIDTWLPLLVTVREGSLDEAELVELSDGFEPYFTRGDAYAVLSLALLDARMPDAVARQRIARWLNDPRVRRLSKELCAGSATVVARAWERHAMTALYWLWSPVAPHRAVATVEEGVRYCLDRLADAGVGLTSSRPQLQADVSRALAALPVAGLTDESSIGAAAARGQSDPASGDRLGILGDVGGRVVLGWVAKRVLWARFTGTLSDALACSYAERLDHLLRQAASVRYFIDSEALESVELVARNTALQALARVQRRLSSVLILSWAGNVSTSASAQLRPLGSLVEATRDRGQFELRLLRAAPNARAIIDAAGSSAAGADEGVRH